MGVEPEADGPDARGSAPRESAATGTALVRIVPQPRAASPRRGKPRLVLWGAGMAVALGLGTIGVRVVQANGTAAAPRVALAQADGSGEALQGLRDEVARLKGSIESLRASAEAARQDEPLRDLRRSVDGLKREIDQVRSSDGVTLAQLSTRVEKADHDPAPRLTEIMTRLDRLDHESGPKGPDPAAQKSADVQNRLERLERQVSAPMATGSIPPVSRPAAAAPNPLPPASPDAKPMLANPQAAAHPAAASVPSASAAAVANAAPTTRTIVARADPGPVKPVPTAAWVLRDVYDGLALVEARGGALREVAPGEYLPGMGEVRSIERRGRAWVVLTSRGAIE